MDESNDDRDVLLNHLAGEFAARHRAGERPRLDEYCALHPDLADDIRAVFPALVELERAKADAGPELAVEVADTPPITHLGDFRLLREVGRGGMGVVYEAEQVSLGRRVAIKLLPVMVFRDPVKRRRFEREARAAAKLHHTNIVPVHGFGEHDGTPYYVMQFIPGLGLDIVIDELGRQPGSGRAPSRPPTAGSTAMSAALARSLLGADLPGTAGWAGPADGPTMTSGGRVGSGPAPPSRPDRGSSGSLSTSGVHLPGQPGSGVIGPVGKKATYWESVARIGVQVGGALAYAHKLGVLHRDIKPANLLLDLDGVVWVADFGLAKADDSDNLTHTGDLLGTFRYMPPEAFEGKSDARSDIYSLGLTLFELVALRPAYQEHDRNKLVKQVTTEDPPRLRKLRKDAPRDLVTVIEKAIDRNPARRYQTAGALADDLQRFLDGRPIAARRATELERMWMWARRRPALAGLAAALVLCLLAGSVVSTVFAFRANEFARDAADREREANSARDAAGRNADAATNARAAAEAEAYHAVLNEVRALRIGHQPEWRDKALGALARLAVMPTPRRDLFELRTEAAATLGTPDIRHVATFGLPPESTGSFTFSPDGRTLLTANTKTGLDFWDVPGHRHLSFVEGWTPGEPARFDPMVAYLPDGQGLAVGTRDQGIVFTDLRGTRTARAPITHGADQPTKLVVSGNGQRLAVAWTGGAGITVHDLAGGTLLGTFPESPFALSPDGRWLAVHEKGEIVLRPVAPGEPPVVLGRHAGVTALAFSPDGALLAACSDHTTVLWNVAKREQYGTLRGHRERVFDVAFSPDGGWIATGSLDYTLRVWETRTVQTVATLPSPASPAYRVRWSPTGEYLGAVMNNTKEVSLYRVTGRHGVQQWLAGHRVELRCVAAHPRRDRLTTSGYSEVSSWDLSVPRPAPAVLEPNTGSITAMAYSPDGSRLATASWEGTGTNPLQTHVLIRDGNTGQVRDRIPWPQIIQVLAFDPAGERLAAADNGGRVVVWDLATSRPVHDFETGFQSDFRSVIFLDRPRRLVTHDKDAVLVFNLETGERERKVDLPGGGVRRVVADRARNRLVVGFENGAIGSVSLPDLTPGPRLDRAHAGRVKYLALSPDGRLLATGDEHRVVLRDAASFEPLLAFPVWAGTLRDLTFDSAGRRLAVVGTDSDVDLWNLDALKDGLADLGLAWDRPTPTPAPTPAPAGEQRRPAVPVIRRPG